MLRGERRNIIADFGDVLEQNAELTWGAPEHLLRHPRERLEQALREEFLATTDEEERNWLEVGILHLAAFLPEPDGSIAVGITRTMKSRTNTVEAITDPEWQAAMHQAARLAALVNARSEAAMEEVRRLRNLER